MESTGIYRSPSNIYDWALFAKIAKALTISEKSSFADVLLFKRKNNNKIRNTRKKIERINKKEKIEIEKIRETKRVIKEIKELEEIEIEFKKLEI